MIKRIVIFEFYNRDNTTFRIAGSKGVLEIKDGLLNSIHFHENYSASSVRIRFVRRSSRKRSLAVQKGLLQITHLI